MYVHPGTTFQLVSLSDLRDMLQFILSLGLLLGLCALLIPSNFGINLQLGLGVGIKYGLHFIFEQK